ncbi:hypothetical protein D0Q53_20865 [Salmonella enterica]|nr:hypothetical protein [Salmonella enterica]EFF4796183.1 hypothetical protein [Escherichia coli]EBJ6658739.1 hypothetical protein [Salmonella enterica]EBL0923983.1 hypothetical protein [Salmonella enterica]ECO7324774.1 hypothetical protein [Salmonella enterica]
MASVSAVPAAVSANASSDWVVFTGKLPQEVKKKLKVVAAEMGIKQQELLAKAVELWMTQNGF